MKRLAACLALLLLAACAPDNVPGRLLVPDDDIYPTLPLNTPLYGKIHVNEATVGDYEYQSFAPITPYGLTEGIHHALEKAHYLTLENREGHYHLETRLLDISREGIFTDTCTARIQYQLFRKDTIVDQQIVIMPGHVTWLEEPNADLRIRQCIILSVRENLTHYMNLLARTTNLPKE